jgi:hypothetical protein
MDEPMLRPAPARRRVLAAALTVLLVVGVIVAVVETRHPAAPGQHPAAQAVSTPAASSRSPNPAARGWRTWSSSRRRPVLTMRIPRRWDATWFNGAPAPIFFPLVDLSEERLDGACPSGPTGPASSRPDTTTCFNGSWPVPADGLIVRWGLDEQPLTHPFEFVPGRPVVIDHRPARRYSGPPNWCTNAGTSSEIDAAILVARHGDATLRMIACLGPHVSTADRAAIGTMLASVRVGR